MQIIPRLFGLQCSFTKIDVDIAWSKISPSDPTGLETIIRPAEARTLESLASQLGWPHLVDFASTMERGPSDLVE